MAYNKRTWATGNVVGAVDLNRMEGGIEENHPGYEYKEEIVTLWEGSVTTEGEEEEAYAIFPYTEQIVADKLCVTFNGTTYVCEKIVNGEDIIYGGYADGNRDFSKYPFTISSGTDSYGIFNEIDTKTAGTYTLKIEADNSTVTTNKGFQKAVKSVGDSGYECTTSLREAFSESGATEVQKETTAPCMALLSYTGFINADEIKVMFNGTEYTCPKQAIGGDVMYGDSSFIEYPFRLGFSESHGNGILTKDPMDFDVTVFAPVMTATVTPCFETAVKTITGGLTVINAYSKQDGDDIIFTLGKTGKEILEILQSDGNIAINISPQESSMDLHFPYSMGGTGLTPIKNAILTAQNKIATSSLKAAAPAFYINIISPYIKEQFVQWQFTTQYLDDYPSYTYSSGK